MSVSYDWVERTSALLKEIEQSSSAAAEGKTPHQVMALGSFRTHLLLGLQALKAAGSRRWRTAIRELTPSLPVTRRRC